MSPRTYAAIRELSAALASERAEGGYSFRVALRGHTVAESSVRALIIPPCPSNYSELDQDRVTESIRRALAKE